jgi:hypothetical protein
MKPAARREGLLLRELPDELLVYDTEENRAHCLNRTAADVFRFADGMRDVDEIARLVAPGARAAEGRALVRLALDRLGEAGLVDAAPASPPPSRRELLRRAALGTATLLPAVASMVAPTPAEAAATCTDSCAGKPDGTPCTCFSQDPCTATCISNTCSDGGGC